MSDLALSFHKEMINLYRITRPEFDYLASRLLFAVTRHGGINVAKILLHASTLSEGFLMLSECGRLDLTVEAVVIKEPWRRLFTAEELDTAINRLKEHGYNVVDL